MTEPRSERHPLDLFSLLSGVVFLGIGVALVVTESSLDSDADLGWVVAVLLIGLGLAGALGSLVRTRPRNAPPAGDAGTEKPDADEHDTGEHDTDEDEEVSP